MALALWPGGDREYRACVRVGAARDAIGAAVAARASGLRLAAVARGRATLLFMEQCGRDSCFARARGILKSDDIVFEHAKPARTDVQHSQGLSAIQAAGEPARIARAIAVARARSGVLAGSGWISRALCAAP